MVAEVEQDSRISKAPLVPAATWTTNGQTMSWKNQKVEEQQVVEVVVEGVEEAERVQTSRRMEEVELVFVVEEEKGCMEVEGRRQLSLGDGPHHGRHHRLMLQRQKVMNA